VLKKIGKSNQKIQKKLESKVDKKSLNKKGSPRKWKALAPRCKGSLTQTNKHKKLLL
jgi:hypothetical protein